MDNWTQKFKFENSMIPETYASVADVKLSNYTRYTSENGIRNYSKPRVTAVVDWLLCRDRVLEVVQSNDSSRLIINTIGRAGMVPSTSTQYTTVKNKTNKLLIGIPHLERTLSSRGFSRVKGFFPGL